MQHGNIRRFEIYGVSVLDRILFQCGSDRSSFVVMTIVLANKMAL
jgi:hypothetical protein